MAKGELKKFIKRRPPWFWWALANLLAAAFVVASWSTCLYLFDFPERPANYELLRKIKRIAPVVSYDYPDAPDGASGDPKDLLNKFYALDEKQLAAHNRYFLRNFITNFKKAKVVNYVEGSYRVTHSRALTSQDFFPRGLVVRAQATVQTDELNEPSPYPVILEILFPLRESSDPTPFPVGHQFDFKYVDHRAYILHAAKIGSHNEPMICLTIVPLTHQNYRTPQGGALPLADPDPLNLRAQFPVMDENRTK